MEKVGGGSLGVGKKFGAAQTNGFLSDGMGSRAESLPCASVFIPPHPRRFAPPGAPTLTGGQTCIYAPAELARSKSKVRWVMPESRGG